MTPTHCGGFWYNQGMNPDCSTHTHYTDYMAHIRAKTPTCTASKRAWRDYYRERRALKRQENRWIPGESTSPN